MVSLIISYFLLSFSLVSAFDYYKRCLLHNKQCVTHCPHFMHPYHTRCDRDTVAQRTCESPGGYVLGYTCGWSRCDCNGDNVLDEGTMQCMPVSDCPTLLHRPDHGKRARNRQSRPRSRPRHRKVVVADDRDLIDLE